MILTNNLKIDTSDSCKLHCIDTTKTAVASTYPPRRWQLPPSLVGSLPSEVNLSSSFGSLCRDLISVSLLGIVGYLGTGVGVGVGVGIGIGRSFGNEKGSGPCVCCGSAIVLVGSREWVAGFRSAKASQLLMGGHSVREGLEKWGIGKR